jgi:tartrate dehydratase beta subunit/fumarate hydratase class I family protein
MYGRQTELKPDILQYIRDLAHVRLLSPYALGETWPSEYRAATVYYDLPPSTASHDTGNHLTTIAVPPLADLAVKPAVDHALATGDVNGILEILCFLVKQHL